MYIVIEDEDFFLSYGDFTRLCNFIRQFPDVSIDILTHGITLPL